MTHSHLLEIWLLIVGVVAAFAAAILPATAMLRRSNAEKLRNLMYLHSKNMFSGDPDTMLKSRERWGKMCDFICSNPDPRVAICGVELRKFGEEIDEELRRRGEERGGGVEMILKVPDDCPCEVRDANGVLLEHCVWADTDSGVAIHLVMDGNGKIVFDRGDDGRLKIKEVTRKHPSPLQYRKLPGEFRETLP